LNHQQYLKRKERGVQKVYYQRKKQARHVPTHEEKLLKKVNRLQRQLDESKHKLDLLRDEAEPEEDEIINCCIEAWAHRNDSPEALEYSDQCEKKKFEYLAKWANRV